MTNTRNCGTNGRNSSGKCEINPETKSRRPNSLKNVNRRSAKIGAYERCFTSFDEAKKMTQVPVLTRLAIAPEGLEPSPHGLRDCAKIAEKPALFHRKSFVFNGVS